MINWKNSIGKGNLLIAFKGKYESIFVELVNYNRRSVTDLYTYSYQYDEKGRYPEGDIQKDDISVIDYASVYNGLDTLVTAVSGAKGIRG